MRASNIKVQNHEEQVAARLLRLCGKGVWRFAASASQGSEWSACQTHVSNSVVLVWCASATKSLVLRYVVLTSARTWSRYRELDSPDYHLFLDRKLLIHLFCLPQIVCIARLSVSYHIRSKFSLPNTFMFRTHASGSRLRCTYTCQPKRPPRTHFLSMQSQAIIFGLGNVVGWRNNFVLLLTVPLLRSPQVISTNSHWGPFCACSMDNESRLRCHLAEQCEQAVL